jgi:hypothetical protein
VFANRDHAAYEIVIDPRKGVKIEFSGSRRQCPNVESKLELVASLPVAPGERVPYGHVVKGRVVAIVYMGEISRWRLDGTTINDFGLSCYVLRGETLPAELKMRGDADGDGWIRRFWDLAVRGGLVRLTGRIDRQGTIWAGFDGRNPPYIKFAEVDRQRPKFVKEHPYLWWHPMERYSGELFGQDQNDGMPYDNRLNNWFR